MTLSQKEHRYAFVDGNNLYLGAKSQKIKLDYRSLRFYLRDKLDVEKAFLFIGYDAMQSQLYEALRSYGFVLVFKPIVIYIDSFGERRMKGNVDAELVLYAAAIEYRNYKQAVIITSDGDFACLMRFLQERRKLAHIITPTKRYSKLLKPFQDKILPLDAFKDAVSMRL